MHLLHDFILIFIPLFVVVDPAGSIPVFLALTDRFPQVKRRRVARRALLIAAATGVGFIAVGQTILAILGVQFADFQIAGGILLVVLAILDLLSSSKPAISSQPLDNDADLQSISAVPLAVPLIIGPATLTTSLLLVNTFAARYGPLYGPRGATLLAAALVAVALLLNLLILFVAMYHADLLARLVGRNIMLVINKIVMILIAAIAVSLIRAGITSIVTSLYAAHP